MTTCSVHRPRKNSHAVGLRCIPAELYGKPLKKKSPSLFSPETPLIFWPKSAKNSPADELIAPSVSNAIGWNTAGRLQYWWLSSWLPTPPLTLLTLLMHWYRSLPVLLTQFNNNNNTRLLAQRQNWWPHRKSDKYANSPNCYLFQVSTNCFRKFGRNHESATCLIAELGHKISVKSNDPRESIFQFQRLSVTLQRFNSILLRGSFEVEDPNK